MKLLPQENWMTFCQNMSAGVELVTRFSGLDAPGAAARVIEEACKHHGVKLPDTGGFTCHSAAEREIPKHGGSVRLSTCSLTWNPLSRSLR